VAVYEHRRCAGECGHADAVEVRPSLGPEEIRTAAKHDTTVFGPGALFRVQRELEPPHPSEGFTAIEVVPFERTRGAGCTNAALILWCDGVLRRSRSGGRTPVSAEDVEVLPGRGDVLRRYVADGWRLFGVSWQPEIADETTTSERVEAGFARMQELLGVSLDVLYCPHAPGPPICWCRKPLPGLGVVLTTRHELDPTKCTYVGVGPQDPRFARRLGFEYRHAENFFPPTA
jgi:histidinol phosphatase-like enzyme